MVGKSGGLMSSVLRSLVVSALMTLMTAGTLNVLPGVARASDGVASRPEVTKSENSRIDGICRLIGRAAQLHRLPPEFLTRLLWKESRFNPGAVSPKGARGIAQFMPETAKLRGLSDPFDPERAIAASAAYLAKLRRQFGNFGLAAAAYNSGESRVARWLAGKTRLPRETRDYVYSITGRPANWFRHSGREIERSALHARLRFHEACRAVPLNPRTALFRMPEDTPWSVQVAGHRKKSTAAAQYARLDTRVRRLVSDAGPALLRARSGTDTGQFWSVEVALASRAHAISLCGKLRAEGGACVVWNN